MATTVFDSATNSIENQIVKIIRLLYISRQAEAKAILNLNQDTIPRGETMRTSVVVLMLLLAGCSTPATQSEIEAVSKPWRDCVIKSVIRLDDGKSDPLSVAYGIEPSCAALYEEVIQTRLKGMRKTFEMQIYMRSTAEDQELKLITDAILIYRKSHVQQSNPVPSDATTDALSAAKSAYARRDFATELKLLLPLAEQGNAVAQNNLGRMYLEGEGVSEDDVEAFRWYRMAADQGNAIAQFTLGYMYSKGQGVPVTFRH